jgi:hypothetical protein
LICPASFNVVKAANPVLQFNGSGQYLLIPEINAGSVFTIEMWFNAMGVDYYNALLNDGYIYGTVGTFYLDNNNVDVPSLSLWSSRTERIKILNVSNGVWHHLVFAADGATSKIYLDGSLAGESDYSPQPVYNNDMEVGMGDASNDFNGKIDEIRLYSRALSEGEVSEHYARQYNNESGLLGLWHLDDNTGDIATDSSGNGYNAVIYGATWSVYSEEAAAAPVTSSERPRAYYNTIPAVTITGAPNKKIWGGKETIIYSANDPDQPPYAIKDSPMSFYYSKDVGATWTEIISGQPNTGKYIFDTTKLPDGKDYRLKIEAADTFNTAGAAVSDIFWIDNSPPYFEIFIPLASSLIQEKDKINLEITASEELAAPPEVKITQSGGAPQVVTVKGSGKKFSASYDVIRGYPGTAKISVNGKDLAGNTGTDITFGGSFSVGRLGPPAPVIKNISNNEVFSGQQIDVFGFAPSSVKVILSLNGVKHTTAPSADGNFSFSGLTLSQANYGMNIITVTSLDSKNVESMDAVLKVKFNSPPQIFWVTEPQGTVFGQKTFEWRGQDVNNDKIVYSFYYSQNGGKTWDMLAEESSESGYDFNSNGYFDDDYRLKVAASDGAAKIDLISGFFSVRNGNTMSLINLPANKSFSAASPILEGTFRLAESPVSSIAFSLDKKEWLDAEAFDGRFDSLSEKFLMKMPVLVDGKHNLFIRLKDVKNKAITAFYTFITDTMPPRSPQILLPMPGEVIDAEKDKNSVLGGIQLAISGKSDAGVDLELNLNNRKYNTAADDRGNFIFKEVNLIPHGINIYDLKAIDESGNVTSVNGAFISNNAPVITVLTPKEGEYAGGEKEIKWEAYDKDGDSLYYAVLYRKAGGEWTSLAENISSNSFKWDVRSLGSGEYELQIAAGDTLTNTIAEIKRIFIDNVPPQIVLNYFGAVLTNNARPVFMGRASDNLSGIADVEYAVDGESWYKAVITGGFGGKNAEYEFFHRFGLADGTHKVRARAVDGAGNFALSEIKEITIDTTAPKIGSGIITIGSVALYPENDGLIRVFAGRPYKMSVSIAGDATEADVSSEKQKFTFTRDKATGLWNGELNFKEAGEENIVIATRDTVGNGQTRRFVGIRAEPQGYVFDETTKERVGGAEIFVYIFDEESASWRLWDGEAWGQKNPFKANGSGEYGFYLPPNKYRFEVKAPGYDGVRSKEMEVKNPYLLGQAVGLRPRAGILQKFFRLF